MSTDNELLTGEKIAFRFEWHWIQLILPFISCISIVGIAWLFYTLTYFHKSKMVITNRRIFGTYGITNSTKINIPLDKIDSFGVVQTPFLSFFNAGTVFFYSSGIKYTIPLLAKESKLLENWFSESQYAFIRQLDSENSDVTSIDI
jgi:hypothetical protein